MSTSRNRRKKTSAEKAQQKPRKKTNGKQDPLIGDAVAAPEPRAFEGFPDGPFDEGEGGDPLYAAQDLMYEAWESMDPVERVELAQEALEISPLCADAYVLLAEEAAETLEEVLELYRRAVAAGEEALGPDAFESYAGHFWGFLETRPYMRARAGLAEVLWDMEKEDEAIEHYQEMLVLNPNDNQGIRYVLATGLLRLDRTQELKELLNEYDEGSCDFAYTKALLAYRDGDDEAEELARYAWNCNRHVPGILSGRVARAKLGGYITVGGEDEATTYIDENGFAWKATPGAVAWLVKTTKGMTSKRRGV